MRTELRTLITLSALTYLSASCAPEAPPESPADAADFEPAPVFFEVPELRAFGGVTGDESRLLEDPARIWEPADFELSSELGFNRVREAVAPELIEGWDVELPPLDARLLGRNLAGNTLFFTATDHAGGEAWMTFGFEGAHWENPDGARQSLGVPDSVPLVRSEDFDSYEGVLPWMDLRYRVQSHDVNKFFVLQAPPPRVDSELGDQRRTALAFVERLRVSPELDIIDAATGTRYQLPVDLEVDGDLLFMDREGAEPVFMLHRPTAMEQDGFEPAYMKGHLRLDEEGVGRFTTWVPHSWLDDPARRYPVAIDPHAGNSTTEGFTCRTTQQSSSPWWSKGDGVFASDGAVVCIEYQRVFDEGISNAELGNATPVKVYWDYDRDQSNFTVYDGGRDGETLRGWNGSVNAATAEGYQSANLPGNDRLFGPRRVYVPPHCEGCPHCAGCGNVTLQEGVSCGGGCERYIFPGSDSDTTQNARDSQRRHWKCGFEACFEYQPDAGGNNTHRIVLEMYEKASASSESWNNPFQSAGCRPVITPRFCDYEITGDASCQRGAWDRVNNSCYDIVNPEAGQGCSLADDGDVCTAQTGVCDAAGSCVRSAEPDGTLCSEQIQLSDAICATGEACDQCAQGVCTAGVCGRAPTEGSACTLEENNNVCTSNAGGRCNADGICERPADIFKVLASCRDTDDDGVADDCDYDTSSVPPAEARCTPAVAGADEACLQADTQGALYGVCEGAVSDIETTGTGRCILLPQPAGTDCTPADVATSCVASASCDGGGSCVTSQGVVCEQPNQCEQWDCVPGQGCVKTANHDDGTVCDGGVCGVRSSCQSGQCQIDEAVDCVATLAPDPDCSEAFCDPEIGCVARPLFPAPTTCRDDGVACTVDACDGVSGQCRHLPNDSLCDQDLDANPCTPEICGAAGCEVGPALGDGEACDHPDGGSGVCITQNCIPRPESCGNGVVDHADENCDDGNFINSDGCLNICRAARCGDLVVELGVEECDGPVAGLALCEAESCRLHRCGDGIVQEGERCDPGADPSCTPLCVPGVPGDGFVTGAERCDAGAGDGPCQWQIEGECHVVGGSDAAPDFQPMLAHSLCWDGNAHTDDSCQLIDGIGQCVHVGPTPGRPGSCAVLENMAPESLRARAVNPQSVVAEGHQLALLIEARDLDQAVVGCACNGLQDAHALRIWDTVRVAWGEPSCGRLLHSPHAEAGGVAHHGPAAIFEAGSLADCESGVATIRATVSDAGSDGSLVDDEDLAVEFTVQIVPAGAAVSDQPTLNLAVAQSSDRLRARAEGACARAPDGWTGSALPTDITPQSSAHANGIVAAGQPVLLYAPPVSRVDTLQVRCGDEVEGCACGGGPVNGTPRQLRDRVSVTWQADRGRFAGNHELASVYVPEAAGEGESGWYEIDIAAQLDDSLPGGADAAPVSLSAQRLRVVSEFFIGASGVADNSPEHVREQLFAVQVQPGSYVDNRDGKLYGTGLLHIDGRGLAGMFGDSLAGLRSDEATFALPVRLSGVALEAQRWSDRQGAQQDVMVATAGVVGWVGAEQRTLGDALQLELNALLIAAGAVASFDGRVQVGADTRIELRGAEITGDLQIYAAGAQVLEVSSAMLSAGGWQYGAFTLAGTLEDAVVDLHTHRGDSEQGRWQVTDDAVDDGDGLALALRIPERQSAGIFVNGDLRLELPSEWSAAPQSAPLHRELSFSAQGLDAAVPLVRDFNADLLGRTMRMRAASHLRFEAGELQTLHAELRTELPFGGALGCFTAAPRVPADGRFITPLQPCPGTPDSFELRAGRFDLSLTNLVLDMDPTAGSDVISNIPLQEMGVFIRDIRVDFPHRWGSPRRPSVAVHGLRLGAEGFEGTLPFDADLPVQLQTLGLTGRVIAAGSELSLHVEDETVSVNASLRLRLTLPASVGLPFASAGDQTLELFVRVDENGNFISTLSRFPTLDLGGGLRLHPRAVTLDFHEGVAMGGLDPRIDGLAFERFDLQLPDRIGGLTLSATGLRWQGGGAGGPTGLSGRVAQNGDWSAQVLGFSARLRQVDVNVNAGVVSRFEVVTALNFDAIGLSADVTLCIDPAGRVSVAAGAENLRFNLFDLFTVDVAPGRFEIGEDPDGTGYVAFDGDATFLPPRAVDAAPGLRVDSHRITHPLRFEDIRVRADGSFGYGAVEVTAPLTMLGLRFTVDSLDMAPISAASVKEALGAMSMRQLAPDWRFAPSAELSTMLEDIDLNDLLGSDSLGSLLARVPASALPEPAVPVTPPGWNLRFLLSRTLLSQGGSLWDAAATHNLGDLLGDDDFSALRLSELIGALKLGDRLGALPLGSLLGGVSSVAPLALGRVSSFRDTATLRGLLDAIGIAPLLGGLGLSADQAQLSVSALFDRAGLGSAIDRPLGDLLESVGLTWPTVQAARWELGTLLGGQPLGDLLAERGYDRCLYGGLETTELTTAGSSQLFTEYLKSFAFRTPLSRTSTSSLGLDPAEVSPGLNVGEQLSNIMGDPTLSDVVEDQFPTVRDLLGAEPDLSSCVPQMNAGQCLGDLPLSRMLTSNAGKMRIQDLVNTFGHTAGSTTLVQLNGSRRRNRLADIAGDPQLDLDSCAGDLPYGFSLDGVFGERDMRELLGSRYETLSLRGLQDAISDGVSLDLRVSINIANFITVADVNVRIDKYGLSLPVVHFGIDLAIFQCFIRMSLTRGAQGWYFVLEGAGPIPGTDYEVAFLGAVGEGIDSHGKYFTLYLEASVGGLDIPLVPPYIKLTAAGGGFGWNFNPRTKVPSRNGIVVKFLMGLGDSSGAIEAIGEMWATIPTSQAQADNGFFAFKLSVYVFKSLEDIGLVLNGSADFLIPYDGSGLFGTICINERCQAEHWFNGVSIRGTVAIEVTGQHLLIDGEMEQAFFGLGWRKLSFYMLLNSSGFTSRFGISVDWEASYGISIGGFGASISAGLKGSLFFGLTLRRGHASIRGSIDLTGWVRIRVHTRLGSACVLCGSLSVQGCFLLALDDAGVRVRACVSVTVFGIFDVGGCATMELWDGC